MPVTRRQSGALAATTRKDAGNEPLDLTEEHLSDGELSELTDLESEDDVPLAKRRKTGAKPVKNTTVRSRKSSRKNVFAGLPLDVLHEVCYLFNSSPCFYMC